MVIEAWPGKPTVTAGFGTVGAFSLDQQLNDIFARQHIIGGLVNGGTRQLFKPLNTVDQFRDLKSRREAGINNILKSMDIGGLSSYMARVLAYESFFTMEPSLIDIQVGRRISQINSKNSHIIYADDNYVKYIDINEINAKQDHEDTEDSNHEREDSVFLDLCSPVLQVEKNGLIRTNRGIAVTQSPQKVDYFIEGNFMHVDGGLMTSGSALATTTDGFLMVLDVENESVVWQQQCPKGCLNGWSRCLSLDPNLVLWCNRYSMATVDLREPPPHTLQDILKGSHFIINFEDHEQAIHDLDSGVDGTDAFALTSFSLDWIDAIGHSKPLMSIDQPLAKDDFSTSIYKAQNKQRNLVTVTSQLTPLTMAVYFGERSGQPTMLDDLYFLESWPTIVPQSHITIENDSGFLLLSVGNEGGLFRQQWNETGRLSAQDSLIDLPPVEVSKLPSSVGKYHDVKPFDLLPLQPFVTFYNFEKLNSLAFRHLPKSDLPISDKQQNHLAHLGALTAKQLQKLCEVAWLEPLTKKQKDGVAVSQELIEQTSRCIDKMIHDMSNIEEISIEPLKDTKLDLSEDVKLTLRSWPAENGNEISSQLYESESSKGWASQPTMSSFSQSQQQSQVHLPMTQPTLRSKKSKHKKKRKVSNL